MTFVGVGGGESFAGAGAVDGAAQILKSIQEGDGYSVGGNALSTALDVLGFVDNPVKAIGSTAIGWLLEHISFLDWFLDHTTGDPGAVQNAAETFFKAAQALDGVAADQIRAYGTSVPTYRSGQSKSAVAFEERVAPRGDELKVLSIQCHGLGATMNAAGALVATCRGFIRDLLTEFAWWIVRKGTIALAAAPYTGGGSLAALLTDTGIYAAKLARTFADKLDTLVRDLTALFTKMQQLAKFLNSSASRALGTSLLKSAAPAYTKAIDDHVSLSAADAAEQQVAEQQAAERRAQAEPPVLQVPYPPPPTRQDPPPHRHGPGLDSVWTTSGNLDE